MRNFVHFVGWIIFTIFFVITASIFVLYGSHTYSSGYQELGAAYLFVGAVWFALAVYGWIQTSNRLRVLLRTL